MSQALYRKMASPEMGPAYRTGTYRHHPAKMPYAASEWDTPTFSPDHAARARPRLPVCLPKPSTACTMISEAAPVDECQNCQAIDSGSFLDLIEIDAASNTSVDDIRDLRDKINFSPSLGRFKVYIIDEVHMLSTAAFNAPAQDPRRTPLPMPFSFWQPPKSTKSRRQCFPPLSAA